MTYATKKPHTHTMRVTCPGAIGIIAAVTSHLAGRGHDICELASYDDEETRRFYMRCTFQTATDCAADPQSLLGPFFATVADRFGMTWSVAPAGRPKRALLLVSNHDHCLRDLLYRWEAGELNMDIAGIVSNHPTLEPMAARHGIPFHHLPVTRETRAAQEDAIRTLVAVHEVELVVLARYMQILSDGLSRDLFGRCINIHHSFLPGFKGASPYAQAHGRGVKLTGATAHYVTAELDEGPIIEQDVRRIDHRFSVAEMQAMGRDVECQVLSRAVRLHLEDRVFLDGSRTIVFA